jgi:hypothetical protein
LPDNHLLASIARPEISALLQRGETELLAAMTSMPQALQRGQALMQMADPHEFLYVVESAPLFVRIIRSD